MANDAFYYVTGPVHSFFRAQTLGGGPGRTIDQLLTSSEIISFIGHTEKSPELAFEPQYKPVFCSLSGEAVPDDQLFLGTTHKIVLDLQRFDLDIINRMLAAPSYGRDFPGVPLGTESFVDRGRLVQAHSDGYELWLQNSFFDTVNAAAYPNLPAGYYFPCCRTTGVYPSQLTRDTKKVRLMIEPLPMRVGIIGGYVSFSKSASAFNSLPEPG